MSEEVEGIDCLGVRTLATEYLEAVLPAGELAAFDRHIGSCDKCSKWFAMLQQAIDELGELSTEELITLNKKVLLDQFRRRRQGLDESDSETGGN